MRLTQFLGSNLKWSFCKDAFAYLRCMPTDEKTLWWQVQKIAERYFPQSQQVQFLDVEFCLNEIALRQAKTPQQKLAKQHFFHFWNQFVVLRNIFDGLVFPSDGKSTRLEQLAQLVAQCTQFALTQQQLQHVCNKICNDVDLLPAEKQHLWGVLQLFQVKMFCAATRDVFDQGNEVRLAKMLDCCNLAGEFCKNTALRQVGFATPQLAACVNCLANSATKFGAPTKTNLKTLFFCGGRNVFDTFCSSKLGKNTAQFLSQNSWLKVEMQYFLQGECEVRRFCLTNSGKAKKLTADFLLEVAQNNGFFVSENALCAAIDEGYCAVLAVGEEAQCCDGRLSLTLQLPQQGEVRFDIVTVFAQNMPKLAQNLQQLRTFGATRCPYLLDSANDNVTTLPYKLHPTMHGHLPRSLPQKQPSTFNFSYQLGDDCAATFLDNAGNCTTLLQGFAFGVGGEKVFAVCGGMMTQANCGNFVLDCDKVIFRKKKFVCEIAHGGGKTYTVNYSNKQKTLFVFPFEEKCTVQLKDNVFCVQSQLRNFCITCHTPIESFSTNALECNAQKPRYKLSNDLQSGTCLAICLASQQCAKVTICGDKAPQPNPLVRESLLSTYLNYLNNKNAFCLHNYLKRADALTVAAICFTNMQFVMQFLQRQHHFFYDSAGGKRNFCDKLTFPLAVVYCASLADRCQPSKEQKQKAQSVLLQQFEGRDLCIKALALKKAAQLQGFDKVQCLLEYAAAKKKITSNSKLYAFAQAIGAVPLLHPSKERLKDLCRQHDVPKSWYYVSQLENLYGMTLLEGKLSFAPKVTQANVLEQLALLVGGKRIDTSFLRAAVQSMTLNGVQYFLPLKTQSIKNNQNTLEVRY